MIITDVRQPEAITDAQVTKVANSSADTKSAAEETPQMPKKVSIVIIKMLIISSKHTLEKKKVWFGLQPWYTERLSGHHAVHLSPTRGHKRTIDKTSFVEPFAQKRLKVNKCDLKPWVPQLHVAVSSTPDLQDYKPERLSLLLAGHCPEQRQVVGAADETAGSSNRDQDLQERV